MDGFLPPFTAGGPGGWAIYGPLTAPRLAAITDALAWSSVRNWRYSHARDRVAAGGHWLRMEQADEVARWIRDMWRRLEEARHGRSD